MIQNFSRNDSGYLGKLPYYYDDADILIEDWKLKYYEEFQDWVKNNKKIYKKPDLFLLA